MSILSNKCFQITLRDELYFKKVFRHYPQPDFTRIMQLNELKSKACLSKDKDKLPLV